PPAGAAVPDSATSVEDGWATANRGPTSPPGPVIRTATSHAHLRITKTPWVPPDHRPVGTHAVPAYRRGRFPRLTAFGTRTASGNRVPERPRMSTKKSGWNNDRTYTMMVRAVLAAGWSATDVYRERLNGFPQT